MGNLGIFNVTKKILEEKQIKGRSSWKRGVAAYALDMLDTLQEQDADGEVIDLEDMDAVKSALLSGARDWRDWVRGGNGLVYNASIAKRLCAPWELRRVQGGYLPPNKSEDWLDVEMRAVSQAWGMLQRTLGIAVFSLSPWTNASQGERVDAIGYTSNAWGSGHCFAIPSGAEEGESLLVWYVFWKECPDYNGTHPVKSIPKKHKIYQSQKGEFVKIDGKRVYLSDIMRVF